MIKFAMVVIFMTVGILSAQYTTDAYFGEQGASPTANAASGYTWYNEIQDAKFVCPGHGDVVLTSLGAICSTATYGRIRIALYNTDKKMICQLNDSIRITSGAASWREGTAFVDSFKNVIETVHLTGQESYRLSVTAAGDNPVLYYVTNAANYRVAIITDYTNGLPGTIGSGTLGTTMRLIRAGVDTSLCSTPTVDHAEIPECTTRTVSKWGHEFTGEIDSVKCDSLNGRPIVAGDSISIVAGTDTVRWRPMFYNDNATEVSLWFFNCGDSVRVRDTVLSIVWDPLQADSLVNAAGVRFANYAVVYTGDTVDLRGYFGGVSDLTLPEQFTAYDTSETSIKCIVNDLGDDSIFDTLVLFVSDTVSSDTFPDALVYMGDYDTASITSDPSPQSGTVGFTAEFSVSATGTGTLTYQWQRYTDSWANEVGETDSTLSIVTEIGDNGDSLRCIVSNDRGSDTSAAALLTVTATYTVTTTDDGNGSAAPAETTVVAGTPANISATPDANYHFLFWSITSGAGTWNPDSVTASTALTPSEDIEVQANFGIDTFYVDTSFNAGCAITFLSAADSIFEYGEPCSLQVAVEVDSLVNWSGGNNIGSLIETVYDTLVFTVTENVNATATAREWPKYAIDSTIANGLPDSVVFDNYGTVDSGTVITVTLGTPADSQWTVSGDTSGVMAELIFTARENWSLVFTLDVIPTPSATTTRRTLWRGFAAGFKRAWR